MKRFSLLFVAAALAAPVAAQIQSNTKDAVTVAMDTFLAGWNNHDPKAIAASFAKDGDVLDPLGHSAKGRKDIEKFFAQKQSPFSINATAAFQITDQKKLKDGLILADADGTLSGVTTPEGKTLPDRKNHIVIVFSQDGDAWQILSLRAYAFTSLPAASDMSPAMPGQAAAPAPAAQPAPAVK